MKITFKELFLTGFKNHRDLQVNFGEETKISGDNGAGKSTIINAPVWAFYGTDVNKSKLDPTPVTYEADSTNVSIILSIDEKEVKLTRELRNGKAKYYINDVPSKATEYDHLVSNLGDKDFFLSLYNPHYFFTLKWDKQREMLLQYVAAPSNKQVLKELHGPQSDRLTELLKKHSLDDLLKIHRENKTKMEKAHIAAESKVKTLKAQLEDLSVQQVDAAAVTNRIKEIDGRIKEIEESSYTAIDNNKAKDKLKVQLESISDQMQMSRELWEPLRVKKVDCHCETCGQELDEESTKKAKEALAARRQEHLNKHGKLKAKRDTILADYRKLEYVDLTKQTDEIKQLGQERHDLIDALNLFNRSQKLVIQVEEAEQDEQEKLSSLNDSIFIIDAIKAFQAKEAELQGEKVQALFTTLSVRLFEEQKNGDIKPTFVIQMDGKDYKMLSLSESIKAGLELREVLSEQSGVVAPTFVDNAESITTFKGPTGQLITSRVVADQELKIESGDE
ncbi:AAA family ATPase [Alkalihalophilus marmarensis]|uniref:AAA family ATPase n=1 Tax=Alkalihalophilus marmarensis TaxID=521377 RepID=UPI00203E582E|nr:AAA family ATPase [Alkalihalophilus marmarensis]